MKLKTAIHKIIEEIIEDGLIADKNIEDARAYLEMKFGMVGAIFYADALYSMAKNVPVSQYTKEGKHLKDYRSISEAGRICGIDHRGISKVCVKNTNRKTAGGFIWKYNTLE